MSGNGPKIVKDLQYYKFCFYGFLKNLRLFEPFLILFFLDNDLSFLQIGFLYSLREIFRNVFEIPGGIISDAIGRKKTMITSFVLYVFSFLIFYFSKGYFEFGVAMVFYALGDAFRTGTHKAMIFDYLKKNRWENQKVHYYGYTRSYSQIGSAISALLAGLVIFLSGEFRIIFIISVIPYLLNLVLISSYPKYLDGVSSQFEIKNVLSSFQKVFNEFIQLFRSSKVLNAIFNLSAFTGYYKALKDYMQPLLKTLALSLPIMTIYNDSQRSSVVVGIVFFIVYLITSFSSRNSGRFSDKFKNLLVPLNLTLVLGMLVGAISGLLYEGSFYLAATIFFIGIYIIENVRKPIGISNVAKYINKDVMASALSIESQLNTLIAAILAPIIGLIADQYGLGHSLIFVSGLMLFLSPLYLLHRKRNDEQKRI